VAAALLLAAAVTVTFLPATEASFLDLDDTAYVTRNPMVLAGLSWPGVRWAFTSAGYAANWHPLTWLSHMLDTTLAGTDPRLPHWGNLTLHLLASLALMAVLRRWTGRLAAPAVAAAIFALHPLRAESVAWVAERKDVLATLLWMLTLLAWNRYASRPGALPYLASAGTFAAALMAKPTAVTLPCVLLLLDRWPLGRWRSARDLPPLLAEKAPLLVLALASGLVTLEAQRRGGSLDLALPVPLPWRLANAATWAVGYLGRTLWPADLAAFYPHPGSAIPLPRLSLALLLLGGATLAVHALRRRLPHLLTGWLWYLVVLLPMSGIVQAGGQAGADRYTYLPSAGLVLLLAPAGRLARRVTLPLAGASLLAVALLASTTRLQCGFWRDSVTLYTRALTVTRDNWFVHNNLGTLLFQGDDLRGAEEHYRRVVDLRPDLPLGWYNLGGALYFQGRKGEALEALGTAVRLKPDFAEARHKLGLVLAELGRQAEARRHLAEAAALDPFLDRAGGEGDLVPLHGGR
jgi:hypothetical protein